MFQYFEDAIEPENRDLKHKALFPSKSVFKGRRWDGWDRDSRQRTIENLEGRLVITHNDADGLVSGALFLDYFDQSDDIQTEVVSIDYENIEETFEYINENGDGIDEIFVSDLNLDEVYSVIGDVASGVSTFVWIDHHEWGEKKEIVDNMGIEITVDQSRCAAGLVYDYILENGYNTSKTVEETVQLTEDHDLWKHEMRNITLGSHEVCISQVFSQLAFYSDTEKFLDEILNYGEDFMQYESELLRGDKEGGFLAQVESEHQMKIKYIVENTTRTEVIGDYRVAFVHGRASPGDILEELVEQEDIDILVHTKPSYPVKASIRSVDDFKSCHKIAEQLGGGGHEQAAGCKPDIVQEPMEFTEYILNHGEELQNEVEKTLREYLDSA